MSIICPTCGFDENPDNSEFCEACGSELGTAVSQPASNTPDASDFSSEQITKQQPESYNFTSEQITTQQPEPEVAFHSTTTADPEPISTPTISETVAPPTPNFSVNTGKLIAKQANTPISEFPLDGNNAIIGRFDSDTGPVDIDLEGFPGEDTISRNHAEIYYEGNQWKIKDLGSTNGVFIKRAHQNRFEARIMRPEVINSGDEIAIAKIRFLFQSP